MWHASLVWLGSQQSFKEKLWAKIYIMPSLPELCGLCVQLRSEGSRESNGICVGGQCHHLSRQGNSSLKKQTSCSPLGKRVERHWLGEWHRAPKHPLQTEAIHLLILLMLLWSISCDCQSVTHTCFHLSQALTFSSLKSALKWFKLLLQWPYCDRCKQAESILNTLYKEMSCFFQSWWRLGLSQYSIVWPEVVVWHFLLLYSLLIYETFQLAILILQ